MRRLTALASLLCLEVTLAQELAVVRPFASSQEIEDMDEAFALWNTVSPCGDKALAEFDLILVYSRKFGQNPDALDAVDRVSTAFRERTQPWHRCFREVHIKAANLTADEDVYDSRGYAVRKDWVNGPNKVFRYILRSFLDNTLAPADYYAFYFMEFDSVPLRSLWLDQLYAEVVIYPRAAIRGSRYRGDSWDPFLDEISAELLQHLNGNAIYFKHPWLEFLADQLEEDEAEGNTSTAFDVRMAALTLQASLEAADNATTSLAAAWKQHVPEGEQPYRDDSLLVGNYANTLLNRSFDAGELVRHAALNNLLRNINQSQLTLAVIAYDDWSESKLLQSLKAAHHPFRNVVILAKGNGESTTEIETPGGPTLLQEKAWDGWAGGSERVLCDAASAVTTEQFVFTDTYHFISGPVQLLVDDEGHLVLPYIPSSSSYCTRHRECSSALDQAETFFGVELLYHHDTFETVFVTEDVKTFCEVWDVAAAYLGSYENCDYLLGPTADDYIAWLISTKRPYRYMPKNKERVGWRPWTSLWTPPPLDERDCSLYREGEYMARLASIDECSFFMENASACDLSPNCSFRPLFESGKCMQTRQFELLPRPPISFTWTSTTTLSATRFTSTDTATATATTTSSTSASTTASFTTSTSTTSSWTPAQTSTATSSTCQVPDIAGADACYSLQPGETCRVLCPVGYQGESSEYTCLENLTFAGEQPECIRTTTSITEESERRCSTGLPMTPGADVSDCFGIAAGAACTARCSGSFAGSPVQYYCAADGVFRPTGAALECQERFCDTSQLPSGYDIASCAQTSVGEVCFVRCPDGYLPAESLHVCGADGVFLGFAPTCELADCNLDLATRAADLSRNFSDCSGVVAGSDCIVRCAFGHQGNPATYTCLPDGTLAGPVPSGPCQPKTCAVPDALADPSFGTNCIGTRHGETCQAACSPGFSGLPEQLRCDNGVLQGSLPKCTGFPCSLEGVWLEPGMDASDCAGKRSLEECFVQCGRGFSSQGSPVMTCQANGRFTQHSLVCARKTCGDLSAVPGFSDASIVNSCAGRGFGEVCSAFCRQGWELQGNATVLVCDDAPDNSAGFSVYFESDGRLVHAAEAGGPFCKARPCTANLPNLQGVQHDCAGKTTHETCTVEAAPGYRFESAAPELTALVCQANGSFVGSIPQILAESCPEVQFGPGVGSTCINIPVDGECWAYCESGWSGLPRKYHCRLSADALELRASEQDINCTAVRRLDASEPGACFDDAMATALSLPELTHSCSEMLHGEVCVVHCSAGWEMVDPSPTIITCDNASLAGGPLPHCRPKQCDFGLPNTLGVSSNCSGAVTGEHCLVVCEEGYYSDSDSGREQFLCTASGSFAGVAPDCRRLSCTDLELGADFQHNCREKLFGESCVVTCAAGFHLSGWGASFVCAGDGRFQGLLPLCQATACASFDDLNFVSTCDSVVTNGNCNVSCGPGYEQNSSVLTCDAAGTLVGQLPICKPEECAVDPSLQSASYSHDCLALPFGRSCSVVCADGYEPDTDEGQQVEPGEQWQCGINDTHASQPTLTGILPSCRPAACDAGYPLQFPAARDNCTAMLTGQICVQTCATGYVPSDTIVDTFRCNPDGALISISGEALACRVATCKLIPLGPGIVTTCAGEVAINSSCNAFCSAGFRLEGPVQEWRCAGPSSELPALDGSDQDVALRGHLPACVPDACAYNIPWEIDFDHNCSSVPTGSFCLVACPGDGNSSLLRCAEDGSLRGALPLCNEVPQSSSETTTRTQTTTTTRVIVLVGKLTVQTNSPDDLGDPEVRAGLTRALAQVLEVSPEHLELVVQAVQGSADLAEVQFSSATAPTVVQLQELQRTAFAEVGRAFAAEFVNYTEADIAAVGRLVLAVQLGNETLEVTITPLEASPDSLQFTTTMTASAGVLLLCCACTGCFIRQRLRQAGEGSECPCSCASAPKESGSLPEVASDVQTSIGEAGSDSWDWEDEGVTRTLPPSREVTAGISSLVMSTSAGSGCPTRSPTMKDLREAANHGDSWLGVVLGEQAEDTTVKKLEALVHGVGFQEPLAERLADAGICLEEDEDGEDGIQEFRLALEDVGVHFEEVHVGVDADSAAPRVKPGVVCSSRVNDQKLDDCMDEDLFEV